MGKVLRIHVFEFLDDVIGDQQRMNLFGLAVIIMHYVQIYASQFIPYIIESNEITWIDSFVGAVVFFSSSTINIFQEIYVIYILFAFFILIVVSFFWAFTQKIKIKGVFIYIRAIIKIFPSILFLFPLIGNAAQKMHNYFYHNQNWYDLVTITMDLIVFVSFILIEYYLTPIIAGTPFCGNSHMPSRILPDFGFTKFVMQDYFSFFILVTSQNQCMKYFYAVFQILISIRRIYFLARMPFYSSIHTNVCITLNFTTILIQAGFIVSNIFNLFNNLLNVSVLSIIFFIFTFIIVEVVQNVNYYKIKSAIEDKDVKYLKKIEPQKILLAIIGKDIGNDSIIKFICKISKGDFKIIMKMISHIYPKNINYLIESNNFISSFIAFRQLRIEKLLEKAEDPSLKFNSALFWSQMLKGNINEAMLEIIENSRLYPFTIHDVCLENPMRTNLVKLMKRENPLIEKVLLGSAYAFAIVFSTFLVFPFFKLNISIGKVVYVPSVLRKSLNIGILWSQLMLAIEHTVNCTMFNNITLQQILIQLHANTPEQFYVIDASIGSSNKDISRIAYTITSEIVDMSKYFNTELSDSFSLIFEYLWYMPKISFPLDLPQKETHMDMRSILLFYLAEISTYHDETESDVNSNLCDTRLTNHFRQNIDTFMNYSMELLMSYSSFINSYKDYISDASIENSLLYTKSQLVHIILFFLASLIASIIWHHVSFKRLYLTILQSFRIKAHPTLYDIEYEDEVSKMNVFKEIFKISVIHVFCGALFFAIITLINFEASKAYDTMMKYNMISVRIENLSLTFTLLIHTYFRSYMFDEQSLLDDFITKVHELDQVIAILDQSFNPIQLKKFRYIENLPEIMKMHESGHELKSLHDIYNTWPIMQLVYLMNSLVSDVPNLLPLDPNQYFFLHINHINLAHFQPGINYVHQLISQLSEDQARLIYFLIDLSSILYCLFIIIVVFILFRKYIKFSRCYRILNTHILKLDPVFLLSQDCLMDYLLSSEKDTNKEVKNMKELYREANIPLILIDRKETIVQFSKPVLEIFGMQEDQLIGHKIKTLFSENHSNFYQNIKNKIAGVHTIDVKSSNDQFLSVEVNVTPLRENVLLEFKNIDDILVFEELIQVHADLYDEIISTSYPTFIVQQSFLTYQNIYRRIFPKFSFLLIITDTQTGDSESQIEAMKQYFSTSIVLSYNCSLWCSIFVGENHMIEAIKCYQNFAYLDEKKAGIIIEGYDLPVFFFGLPDEFDWTNIEALITSIPPYISIEPKFNIFDYYKYINRLTIGQLIGSRSIMKYFDYSIVTTFDSDLVMINNLDVSSKEFFEPVNSKHFQSINF